MAIKQVAANVVEYLKPLWTIKPKIAILGNQFNRCLQSFEEDFGEAEMNEVLNEQKKIREYQARRNLLLDAGGANVIDCYMELIVQFGFITLFSEVFPLAAMFSLLSNNIQINS